MTPSSPQQFKQGRYAVVRPLGEGSQAETLEAVDKQYGRAVAIKRFSIRGAKQWKDVELAEREARVLASLSHPLLPAYLDYFEEDGALYLVMEKIEGESLAELRQRHCTLAQGEISQFLRDAAQVLEYLHQRAPPVIHRDIKPGNVIRRPDGSFVLVDFGSVRDRLKPQGGSTVVGTFGYMAPEQFQGRALPASDVYAVGATALVMLTGSEPEHLPHRGLAIDVAAALRGYAEPELVRVLSAMLDPDPDRRASSIAPLLYQLGQRARAATHERQSQGRSQRARREARAERHETRADRRAEYHARRARRGFRSHTPIGPLLIVLFSIGLIVARVGVSFALRVFVPILLTLLSLFFGAALRRAAQRVGEAGVKADGALDRALGFVHGKRDQPMVVDTEGSEISSSDKNREHIRVTTEFDADSIAHSERDADDRADDPSESVGYRRRNQR